MTYGDIDNASDYGPWIVQVKTLDGKPVNYACNVEAGSASEARDKARKLGYGGVGNARPFYAHDPKRFHTVAR